MLSPNLHKQPIESVMPDPNLIVHWEACTNTAGHPMYSLESLGLLLSYVQQNMSEWIPFQDYDFQCL